MSYVKMLKTALISVPVVAIIGYLISVSAGVTVVAPQESRAQETRLGYASILKVADTALDVSYGGPLREARLTLRCDLATRDCQTPTPTPSVSPSKTPRPTPNPAFEKLRPFKKTRVGAALLSPGGRFVAYYQPAGSVTSRGFGIADLKTRKTWEYRSTVAYWDLLAEELSLFAFAPDESKLIYLDDRDGYPTLYAVDLTGSTIAMAGKPLLESHYSVSDFMFWDAKTLFFMANREHPLKWNLYRLDLPIGAITTIAADVSYGQSISRAGEYLVFLQIAGRQVLPRLYHVAQQTMAELKLPSQAADPAAITTELVQFGQTTGVLIKPKDFSPSRQYPLLVWLHGGPYRQTLPTYHPYISYGVYDWALEEVARNGAIVLKLNYHGSYGQGRAFAEAIKGNVGKIDVEDVLTAGQTLRQQLPISQVYLVGNSYGGYLSLRALVEQPQDFGGAMSINGVTDWATLLKKLRTSIFNVHFGGTPNKKNTGLYNQASVLQRIGNLTNQKVVLVHGQKDTTIMPTQGDLLNSALEKQGKLVTLVKYPQEEHVLRQTDTLQDLCRRLFDLVGQTAPDSACRLAQ